MGRLTDWIREKVKTVSRCEIIENYPTYNGRANIARIARARLQVVENERGDYRPGILVSIQQDDGLWRQRTGKMRWGMPPPTDTKERYLVCIATTLLKYKGWTTSPKEMIGFLRVGIRGAVLLFANGDRMEIAMPPFRTEPPTHLQTMVVGENGFLCDQTAPNPDYTAWQTWAREVSEVTAHLRGRVERAGDRIDPADHLKNPKAICEMCGAHAAQDPNPDAAWRKCGERFYCEGCNGARHA